jgi:aspartyl protease
VPHFTLPVGPNGPVVRAYIAVSKPRGKALKAAGLPIPAAVPIDALLDTGASCTCVDRSVLEQLSLTPTGSVSVATPSTETTPELKDQYDVALIIPDGGAPLILETIPVVASSLFALQGFHALIGRDILNECVFVYAGRGGVQVFTLAY